MFDFDQLKGNVSHCAGELKRYYAIFYLNVGSIMRVLIFVAFSLVCGIGCIKSSIKPWDLKTPEFDSADSSTSIIGFKYKEVHRDAFVTMDFCFVDTNNSWRISEYKSRYYIDHFTNDFKKCESRLIGEELGRPSEIVWMSSCRILLIIANEEIFYSRNYANEWQSLNLGSQIHEKIEKVKSVPVNKSEKQYVIVNDSTFVSIDSELKVQKIELPNPSVWLRNITVKGDTIIGFSSTKKIYYSLAPLSWDSISAKENSDYMHLWGYSSFISIKDSRIFVFNSWNNLPCLYSDDFGKSWQRIQLDWDTNPDIYNQGAKPDIYNLGDYLVIKTEYGFIYSINGGRDWDIASGKPIFRNIGINKETYGFFSDNNNVLYFVEKISWNQNCVIYKLEAKSSNDFVKILNYKTVDYEDSIKVVIELDKHGEPGTKYILKVLGTDTFNFNKRTGPEILLDAAIEIGNSKKIYFKFPVSTINANRFIPYKLKVELTDNSVENLYILGPIAYNPSSFFKENPKLTILLLTILCYVSLLSLMLLFQPYWLFVIHSRLKAIRSLEDSLGYFGVVIKVLREITFIPLFVAHRRTLDAWIGKHGGQLNAYFERKGSVQSKRGYIPLPVRSEDNNTPIIEKPSPESLSRFFKKEVVCIQIIGVGGIGKTTFAVQMGRWLASSENKKYFGNHLWIPVLIEQDITDMLTALNLEICSVTEHMDEEFLKLLLRKRRLLLIFDSLSEREEATQEYVEKIHGVVPVNAMLITSRRKLNVASNDAITLYPLELAPEKLLYFISHALQSLQMDILKSARNQIQLANKLSNIFISRGKEIPVIPILIQLVIGQIAKMAVLEEYQDNIEKLLADIPDSIPEIFFEYLNRVNPEDKAPNALKNEDMRHAAEIIAQLSLGDNFIPQDIQRQKVENVLKEKGLLTEKADPINRLIDNGILETRKYGGKQFLRFSLDPLSEYLAAMRYAEENDKDAEKWEKLYEKIKGKGENASGFLQALELVHEAYWEKFKWFAPVG